MASRMNISGSYVALVTPFANGEVDYETLARLIEFQIASGTQGLVPCGTTGESPTLTHVEQNRVTSFTVEQAGGRVPVIAGTGSNSTTEALQLTQHAKDREHPTEHKGSPVLFGQIASLKYYGMMKDDRHEHASTRSHHDTPENQQDYQKNQQATGNREYLFAAAN